MKPQNSSKTKSEQPDVLTWAVIEACERASTDVIKMRVLGNQIIAYDAVRGLACRCKCFTVDQLTITLADSYNGFPVCSFNMEEPQSMDELTEMMEIIRMASEKHGYFYRTLRLRLGKTY